MDLQTADLISTITPLAVHDQFRDLALESGVTDKASLIDFVDCLTADTTEFRPRLTIAAKRLRRTIDEVGAHGDMRDYQAILQGTSRHCIPSYAQCEKMKKAIRSRDVTSCVSLFRDHGVKAVTSFFAVRGSVDEGILAQTAVEPTNAKEVWSTVAARLESTLTPFADLSDQLLAATQNSPSWIATAKVTIDMKLQTTQMLEEHKKMLLDSRKRPMEYSDGPDLKRRRTEGGKGEGKGPRYSESSALLELFDGKSEIDRAKFLSFISKKHNIDLEIVEEAAGKIEKAEVCFNDLRDRCARGSACRYIHESDAGAKKTLSIINTAKFFVKGSGLTISP